VLGRLFRANDGAALVEFAMVLPVLLTMFMGTYVISDSISCYRKVTVTARTLADLVGRNVSPSSTPTSAALATYINSAALVLTPYNSTSATLEIDQLRVCDATHAYVVWSQAQTGTTTATPALTAGTVVSIPANLITTPMIPTSPDGTNVCSNATPATNRTVVGTAGGFLLLGQASYDYRPLFNINNVSHYPITDRIYMIPRLT
jgi:Flp pilus assembly protein TadG